MTGLVKERPAAKDLASFAKQLQQLDATPEEVGTIKLFPPDGCSEQFFWKFIQEDRGRSCALLLSLVLNCKAVTDGLDKRPTMLEFQKVYAADSINASIVNLLFAKR